MPPGDKNDARPSKCKSVSVCFDGPSILFTFDIATLSPTRILNPSIISARSVTPVYDTKPDHRS